jgi:protein-S-isoprenylcysteine O-methyltransferase Ste14
MITPIDHIALAVFLLVIVCWLGFFGVFLFFKSKRSSQPRARRESASSIGIALQFMSYGVLWTWPLQRDHFTPMFPMAPAAELVFAGFTVLLAAGSVWLVAAAAYTLGKQWALVASLVKDHQLITQGPYAWVRNPIYTGMFGLLLATGLAVSQWWALVIAVVTFAIGTVIRVRSEEKLLREAFGKEFEQYARRVPAVLPGIY